VDKLSAESGELEYRLVTTDAAAAREVALGTPDLHLVDAPVTGLRASGDAIVVRAAVAALDELVVRLVYAGIAVRELALVISPLEAAFLALTETQEDDR
jgi:ABC-2 type transport system ATP-binding protein